MSHTPSSRPALPVGWFYPDPETARRLRDELQRELPPGHLLTGRAVETFVWREHASDDVLFRHIDEPERFTVIHLSWLGRAEINAQHPTVEFDGTFAGFLADEEARYGLTPPKDKITPANAGGSRRPAIRAPWAARIAEFCRYA